MWKYLILHRISWLFHPENYAARLSLIQMKNLISSKILAHLRIFCFTYFRHWNFAWTLKAIEKSNQKSSNCCKFRESIKSFIKHISFKSDNWPCKQHKLWEIFFVQLWKRIACESKFCRRFYSINHILLSKNSRRQILCFIFFRIFFVSLFHLFQQLEKIVVICFFIDLLKSLETEKKMENLK